MRESIRRVIRRFGEPVEFTPKGGSTIYLTASVQVPVSDSIVNDYDLTGFVVYIPAEDLPNPPEKFDRIKIRGAFRGIEEVQQENLSGDFLVYIVRVRG